jgi:tellurite resistance protein TerC
LLNRTVYLTYRVARRIVVVVVGFTVLLAGVVMIVVPGPALIVIPVGLAILGIEFAWARFWLNHVRERLSGHNAQGFADRAESHRERVHRR